MELKATKYKQTEIGLIPENWNEYRLKDLCTFINDGTHHTPNYVNTGIPFYSVENVSANDFINVKYITEEEHNRLIKRCKPERGDILLTRIGTLGITKKISWDVNASIYVSLALLKIKTNISSDYLFEYSKSNFFVKGILSRSLLNATPQKINMGEIGDVPIILPPTISEQEAIAKVLSDTDNLIQALEQKIEKKKLIKKGAMQKLLTPKEDWVSLPLTSVVDYIHGKAHEQDIVEHGKYTVVNSKFVSTDGQVAKYSNVNNCKAKKGDILTVLSDLPNGKALAKCYYVSEDDKYAVNQRICIWRSNANNDSMFLKYLLNRHKYFLSLDDGVTQTHILNHHIEKCIISVPKTIEEQETIGNVLFDIDKELSGLMHKQAKLKEVKQGLMQQLLTGKIRLV